MGGTTPPPEEPALHVRYSASAVAGIGVFELDPGGAIEAGAMLGATWLPSVAVHVRGMGVWHDEGRQPGWELGRAARADLGWPIPLPAGWEVGPRASVEDAAFSHAGEFAGGYVDGSVGITLSHLQVRGAIQSWSIYVGMGVGGFKLGDMGFRAPEAEASLHLKGGWLVVANASFVNLSIDLGWEFNDRHGR